MIMPAPFYPSKENSNKSELPKLSRDQFITALTDLGKVRYHSLHPFHKLLHNGELSFEQVQAWALNRFYYQWSIPRKDLTLMARINDVNLRLEWRSRVIDHEGDIDGSGGIKRYLQLCETLKLDLSYVKSCEGILPGTRFAVDAYVNFVQEKSLLEGIASSLTEIYAPAIHQERISGLSKHYDWANDYALAYFKKRINQARRDVEFGREWVIDNALTRSDQEAVLNAVKFKTEVLWAQLDALYYAYVDPGNIPPGAFVPENLNNKTDK
ncbi:MAG: Pyrroloquinoline-quinone synthase [Alphaproteobacteria bacterium MarineAlpha9_Bin4]|nr:MAG: Pyrroloquinoline-quinone synthase [Alphaproteobacteria bacterium MarineAlpha9_Bin4]|tara:strand:- start:1027 stop:1830 length:804 start_codon:yes stop_codon:yes gene_type:complete